MLNLFGLFGKLGQYATWVIIAVLLFFGFRWLWLRPELINPTAKAYKTHLTALQSDSINQRLAIINLGGVIVMKDSSIARLGREITRALEFGQQWKQKFTDQVNLSDRQTDALTDKQREVAYYKALQKNGTLPPSTGPVLLPFNSPIVVKAGLKTANREEIARLSNDSLSVSIGHYQQANQRLSEGLSTAVQGFTQLSAQAKANQSGGIPILRRKRVQQNKKIQAKADSLRKTIEAVSDLEKDLNHL